MTQTTKPLSKQAEQQLLQATEDIADLVADGSMTPTQAAVKVAREYGFNRNFLTLCCQAYNVGATNHRLETGGSTLEKFASFPIADAEAAAQELWPKTVLSPRESSKASDVSAAYDKPYRPQGVLLKAASDKGREWRTSQLEKCAAVQEPPQESPHAGWLKFARERKAALSELEAARTESRLAQDRLLAKIAELTEWFRPIGRMESLPDVGMSVVAGRGEPGQALMSLLQARFPTAMAKHAKYCTTRVDWSAEPYCLFDQTIGLTEAVLKAKADYLAKDAAFQEKFSKAPWEEKQADWARPVAYGTGGALGRDIYESLSANTASGVQSMLGKLSDPAQEDEIRRIQVQAMLADVMSDPVLSGYDPVDVLSAYNELAQSGPRAASQPAVVTPLLRKRLASGILEPFEVKDLADTEKSIVQARNPRMGSGGEYGG